MPSGPHPSSRTPRSQLHPRSAKGPAREVTVHLGEVISTVHIYVTPADAPRKAGKGRPIRGLVSFETSAKQKFVANLLECWIPAGTWKLRPSKKREAGSDVEVLAPQLELLWAQDPEAARAAGRAAVANGVLWLSQPDSDADLKTLGRLFEVSARPTAHGRWAAGVGRFGEYECGLRSRRRARPPSSAGAARRGGGGASRRRASGTRR